MEREPIPGIQPGMADHAPTKVVEAGVGPGAMRRFSRVPELWAEDATYDALNLRFRAPHVTP